MILNNAPINEAVLSNVGEIGEFKIKNSSKAFHILSNSLYANKIRAIVRELSCNAYDSHIAAGKRGVPFDVHMPSLLEPYFSVRDYGTGLSHDQVTQIYTTYFESTKTSSNDFVGALGLGSKSPFSYTDNFTVTAIQNNKKGIYTAFINDTGVPSIALMMSEETTDPNGVEVKFAVDSANDFSRFTDEARSVFAFFETAPVVSGARNFKVDKYEYETRDIIPGVHVRTYGQNTSYAVMGSIGYPINIPNANTVLGPLSSLLSCGLELHFKIGDLDFQASREGLSYIPLTITTIKNRLTELNDHLVTYITQEAEAIPNLWDRALYLHKKREHPLWRAAVVQYANTTKIATYDAVNPSNCRPTTFMISVDDLSKKYNISVSGVTTMRGYSAKTINADIEYGVRKPDGTCDKVQVWKFTVSDTTRFAVNDTKIGASERIKYHVKNDKDTPYSMGIFILNKADKTKDMLLDAFYADILNPPDTLKFAVSTLSERPRAGGIGKNVSIIRLSNNTSYRYGRKYDDVVWRDAGKLSTFDTKTAHYYVPLVGFQMQSTKGYSSGKDLYYDLTHVKELFNDPIYGVRKADIDAVKSLPNWINLEDHLTTVINKLNMVELKKSIAKSNLDNAGYYNFQNKEILSKISKDGLYHKVITELSTIPDSKINLSVMSKLIKKFGADPSLDITNTTADTKQYGSMITNMQKRYPMLSLVSGVNTRAIIEYINLVDKNTIT